MECPHCHTKNDQDGFFCIRCGRKLYIAFLQRKDSTKFEDTYYLLPDTYSIGRDQSNRIVINDPKVSRWHARIIFEKDEFYIFDLGSKNGVIVNNEIINHVKLSEGDSIQIGKGNFLFKKEDELQSAEISTEDQTIGRILKILSGINQTFHVSHSPEEILRIILDSVIEITRCQRGFLILYRKDKMAEFTLARNMNRETLDDESLEYSMSVVNTAIETGKMVIVENAPQNDDFRDHASVINLRLMSLICLPIVSLHYDPNARIGIKVGERAILGVIYVDNQRLTKPLSDRRKEVLHTLTNQAALAIENALLLRERIEKKKIDRELELAHTIQQKLLPENIPDFKHLDIAGINIPCKLIGGDYYDFIKLKNDKIGIVIADVCGKGVPAALLMSSLHATLKSQIQYVHTIEDIVLNLNNAMIQTAPSNRFITFFIGIYDPGNQSFQYVSCGHDPALLFRTNGDFELLKSTGIPIGIRQPIEFETKSVQLHSNDVLLLYTDGVIEARDHAGKQFGIEKLKQTLMKTIDQCEAAEMSCEIIVENILEYVGCFSGQNEQRDDMTLVAIRPL